MFLSWFPPLPFNNRIRVFGEMWLYRTTVLKYKGRQNRLFTLAYHRFLSQSSVHLKEKDNAINMS